VPGVKLAVNLIPFNDIGNHLYQTPTHDAVVAFQQQPWSQAIHAHIRVTRGDDESAACGLLVTTKQKENPSRPI
jgi:23S rRNA (adenine2503-C2)-methyltransferase